MSKDKEENTVYHGAETSAVEQIHKVHLGDKLVENNASNHDPLETTKNGIKMEENEVYQGIDAEEAQSPSAVYLVLEKPDDPSTNNYTGLKVESKKGQTVEEMADNDHKLAVGIS